MRKFKPFKSVCDRCNSKYTIHHKVDKDRLNFCHKCRNNHHRKSIKCSATVKKAVDYGVLPRLDGTVYCKDCGDIADRYDHRDYDKPLEVDPVCGACNNLRGYGLNWFDENRPPWPKWNKEVKK